MTSTKEELRAAMEAQVKRNRNADSDASTELATRSESIEAEPRNTTSGQDTTAADELLKQLQPDLDTVKNEELCIILPDGRLYNAISEEESDAQARDLRRIALSLAQRQNLHPSHILDINTMMIRVEGNPAKKCHLVIILVVDSPQSLNELWDTSEKSAMTTVIDLYVQSELLRDAKQESLSWRHAHQKTSST